MKYNIVKIDITNLSCQDTLLRQISLPIEKINSDIRMIINAMIFHLNSISYATGISSVQVGCPLRLFIVNISKKPNRELIAINPEIISLSGRYEIRDEGCLSLPNYKGKVKRRKKITFKALDINGKEYVYSAEGYESAVIQHEFDHLNGILFWDKLESNLLPIADKYV